jgi:cytoskeletal protein CcmA (bactofilin family)
MANWIEDLGIPMRPTRHGRVRSSAPQRLVEPSIQPRTPPPMVEIRQEGDPSRSESARAALPIRQSAPSVASRDDAVDVRTLIVGQEVSLSGEVSSCDRFIVEGTVHAKIEGCESLTIADIGEFEGYASSLNVDVRGRFDGDLIVRGRLLIRATGRVSGKITYMEIEIERGGQISGEIHTLEDGGFTLDWNTRRHGNTHE